jgi:AcrR family transcriptional regulator
VSSTRPPQQRRSQETLTRLLGAAESLLEEKSFREVSVNEIVQRAGSSIGAFYARFANKQALLECLTEAFTRDTEEEARRLAVSRDWGATPLETAIAEYVRVLVRQHRKHRGTLRALASASMTRGRDAVDLGHAGMVPPLPLIDLIANRRSEIGHPNPDVAAHLGLGMIVSAIRERVLFPELSASPRPMTPVTDAVFAEELARALVGFLGVNATRPSG